MAETQLGKEIIEVIETLEKAAKAIMALKDHMVQAKDTLDKRDEQEHCPGSTT